MCFVQLKSYYYFLIYSKKRAGRTTSDELQTHLLDLQKMFIVAEGSVSSDIFYLLKIDKTCLLQLVVFFSFQVFSFVNIVHYIIKINMQIFIRLFINKCSDLFILLLINESCI